MTISDEQFEADMAKLAAQFEREAQERARVARVLIELAERLDRIERRLGMTDSNAGALEGKG